MTIRKRLTLSFLAILMLFVMNLVIYFWGNQRRRATVEALRRAISRQALISSVSQSLNNTQKQVTLLSQLATDPGVASADPAEIAQFNNQLENIEKQVNELQELSDLYSRSDVESFAKDYRNLRASWQAFYNNFGINQTKAITELVVRAEPLAQEAIQKHLPHLQNDEKARVEAASANFYQVARLTDRTTILIFAVSAVLAISVAFLVSRQLTLGLNRLKEGAALIGGGKLDHEMEVKGRDELAELARAFNDMSGKLLTARGQLTFAHEQEQKKSEELGRALDQLRKTQDQLVAQQKLASLGALTAGIAHEIKNPLNFVTNFAEVSVELAKEIRGSLEAARERFDPKEFSNIQEILDAFQQNTSKIEQHGKRADGIVRNMLMHSRGQAGERQMTNINALLSEYVKLAYHGMRALDSNFNVTIHEDYDASIGMISVIPHDLSRVFLNIANNACYAAYAKKKKIGNGFSPTISAKTKNLGRAVEIRIRDNGDGIDEAVRQRLFEPFFTTKPAGSGTGLGLSMSYEIVVQQHKGEIRVETEPGQYAEFIIILPKENS